MILTLDPHAHLYDTFSSHGWVVAALRNLKNGSISQIGKLAPSFNCVTVVDRSGQDSFLRLRREISDFASWEEWGEDGSGSSSSLIASITLHNSGERLYLIRGVQYVSIERIEVLGLGVNREAKDGALAALGLIDLISNAGGVACLPWSPGKWLAARGRVVSEIISSGDNKGVCFGDIALRVSLGVPSVHLRRSAARGFRILAGSDPLAIGFDESLVGSYGVCINIQGSEIAGLGEVYRSILAGLRARNTEVRIFGGGYNPLKGGLRYLGDRLRARLSPG